MMKARTLFFIAVGLLILIALFTFSTRDQEPLQSFTATVNSDCAPWDGSAFTVSFRYDPITTITVSIWQSPDIRFPTTFSFPAETGRIGVAYSLREIDPLEELSGSVSFERVETGMPIEGRFSLTSARGEKLEGSFIAEWGYTVAMCG